MEIQSYGSTYQLSFRKNTYPAGNLSVQVLYKAEDDNYWKPFTNLTTDLGTLPADSLAYLNYNHSKLLCDDILKRGWAEKIDEVREGFITYPLVRFSNEFLEEVCAN